MVEIQHRLTKIYSKILRDDILMLQTEGDRSKKVVQIYFFGVKKHEFEVRFSIRPNHKELWGSEQNIG